MNVPLAVQYTKSAEKYLEKLDSTTRDRVKKKVSVVAGEPLNVKHSLPLTGSDKRRARVGKYRIILLIIEADSVLIVVEIDSRGQIYRSL